MFASRMLAFLINDTNKLQVLSRDLPIQHHRWRQVVTSTGRDRVTPHNALGKNTVGTGGRNQAERQLTS
jgi:hypothetical protein